LATLILTFFSRKAHIIAPRAESNSHTIRLNHSGNVSHDAHPAGKTAGANWRAEFYATAEPAVIWAWAARNIERLIEELD
jgi:hypothetical protein